MRPHGHRQTVTWEHPFARGGQPWPLMVTTKRRERCLPRRKARGHRVRSIAGNDGKVHPFAGCATPWALIDATIEPEGLSDPGRRTLPLVLFDTVIDGRAVPPCANVA
jgi:hypothetical protein